MEIFSTDSRPTTRARIEVHPEVRITVELVRELRISPRFSDDGAPEGTIDRPKGHAAKDEETEAALDLDVYAFHP